MESAARWLTVGSAGSRLCTGAETGTTTGLSASTPSISQRGTGEPCRQARIELQWGPSAKGQGLSR
jgi:hypothetical protein